MNAPTSQISACPDRVPGAWHAFDEIDIDGVAQALHGVATHTALHAIELDDPRIELRLKLENRQETGAFKARGAWNQVRLLQPAEKAAGVVGCSSGNHGKALAWAAKRAGVAATIVMPHDSYPNKIQACRDLGANVVLSESRRAADDDCAALVADGMKLVHPYDAENTVAGAGTVGLEIAHDWPAVEVVVIPVGGGGLISGSSLALRRRLGDSITILGAEPTGAANMTLALAAGKPVDLDEITTKVQGLCPMNAGDLNVRIARTTLDGVVTLPDELIFATQAWLVAAGEVVEPAGAAAPAVAYHAVLPERLLAGRSKDDPLRVAAVVSGGNPDPAQLAALRANA